LHPGQLERAGYKCLSALFQKGLNRYNRARIRHVAEKRSATGPGIYASHKQTGVVLAVDNNEISRCKFGDAALSADAAAAPQSPTL
jgi:hypothetical protein